MTEPHRRLTISDVTNGYGVRIVRADRSTFLDSSPTAGHPAARTFFVKLKDARTYVKELREHGMTGRVVRARVVFKAE